MKEIILATNNQGKLRELRQIFSQFKIISLADANINVDVVEDADTFLGNASKKATEIYNIAHTPVIADDSGLSIDALDGFPGVLTHRFLGDEATDEDRNAELIRRTDKCDSHTARFICELAYYDGSQIVSGHGELVGEIATSPRGDNGFGFDPIFELADGRTLAELTPVEKDQLSARRLAATDLAKKLGAYL